MKKLIFMIIILHSSFILFGQDNEPNPWKFRWGHSDEPRIFLADSFKQSKMYTGFQWSNTLPMDNSLLNNCVPNMVWNK